MTRLNRREFGGAALGALGSAAMLSGAAAEEKPPGRLPTVRWGKHEITRLLVGHNPIKGVSHFSTDLSRDMREWFAADPDRAVQLIRRSEQLGNVCDALMREGEIERVRENLKMFRDAGLLVGLGSHNHEVIDHAEDKGWDLDFYQCCFYRSCFSLRPIRPGEVFEDVDRRAMAATIRRVSKPCLAFEVLAANRHCHTPAAVEAAIRFAYQNIKPTDVVLLGMWQKYQDQVAENVGYARKALGVV